MTERRAEGSGRRSSDLAHDAVMEAAKEAARVVTAAGIVELVDEVRKLRKAFGDYGVLLEAKLHRRWRLVLTATVLTVVVLCGFAFTLYKIDQANKRALMAACAQRKDLETAILNVIRPSLGEPPEPGQSVGEYRRQQEGLERVIAGIESPPCSEQVE